MKNTDTREVIMISIRLSDKNLQADYYPFILEPEARHLFLKELASHFAARTDLLDIQQHLDEILLTLDGQQTESYTFALTLPRLISITLDTCNACGKNRQWFRSLSACIVILCELVTLLLSVMDTVSTVTPPRLKMSTTVSASISSTPSARNTHTLLIDSSCSSALWQKK